MSLNGLNNTVFPLTIDGTTALDVSSLTIDGTNIDITGLVPYTGATQTLNMGAQNIQTSHTPTAPNDVINLTTLQSAVTYVDTSVALTYLNKITTSSQIVAGQVTFNKPVIIDDSLTVNPTKTANLASVVDVSPNYKRAETDAGVTANYRFGSISNAGGIYTATTTGDFATLGLANLTADKLYKINLYVRAFPTATYTTSIQLYSSADGTNPAYSLNYSASYTPASPNTFQLITGNFTISTGYTKLILLCLNTNNPSYVTPVEWYGLELFDMGVALTNASMPSQTADRVLVLNTNKQVVASGINTTKLGYLDNVSSDIQTQLNAKLNLSGSNANQNIVIGSYKVQSSAVPSTGDDYTNKTYVDSAISGASSLYVLKAGDTMTGTLAMGANKVTSSYTPVNADDLTRKGWVDSQLALYLPLTGGTISSSLTVGGTLSISTRLLGTPDANPGNFWMGLAGSGSETDRLAISINGAQTTGVVAQVIIGKPLALSSLTASRALFLDGGKVVSSSATTSTELGYLSGVTSAVQTQLNGKANLTGGNTFTGTQTYSDKTASTVAVFDGTKALVSSSVTTTTLGYLDATSSVQTQLNARVLKAGDTMTGNLLVNALVGVNQSSPQWKIHANNTNAWVTGSSAHASAIIGVGGGDNNPDYQYVVYPNPAQSDTGVTGLYWWSADMLTGRYKNEFRLAWWKEIHGGVLGNAYKEGITVYLTDSGGYTNLDYIKLNGNTTVKGTLTTTSALFSQSSNTVYSMKHANTFCHISNSAGEVYEFIASQGHVGIGTSDVRDATTCNLVLGVSSDEGEVYARNTDNTAYLPMNYAGSKHTFAGNVLMNSKLGIGTTSPGGTFHVYEATGTAPTGTTGSIYLSHGNTGSQSIVFNSKANSPSDYGFIQFIDSVVATGYTQYNYFGSASSETCALVLGCENDDSVSYGPDCVIIKAGSIVLDPTTYGVIYMKSKVGLGTTNPLCSFYNYSAGSTGWKGMSFFGNDSTGIVVGTYNNRAYLGAHNTALNAWNDTYLAPGGNVRVGGTDTPSYKVHVTGDIYASGRLLNDGGCKIVVQNSTDGGPDRGIFLWNSGDSAWGIYMGQSGYGHSLSAYYPVACSGYNFFQHAVRIRCYGPNTANGIIFENSSNECIASFRSDGNSFISNNTTVQGRLSAGPSVDGFSPYGHVNIRNPDGSYTHWGTSERVNYVRGGKTLFDTSTDTFWHLNWYYDATSPGAHLHNWDGTWPVSIWATGAIVTNYWFGTVSDRRIKKNIKPVGSMMDIIKRIEVVSFDFIDSNHKRDECGVIAQQVETVFPNIVDRSVGVIPNILKRASSYEKGEGTLTVFYPRQATDDLAIGSRVKLMFGTVGETEADSKKKGEYTEKVLQVAPDSIVVEWTSPDDISGLSLLVYGKEVDDFRNVDKEQFAVMAIKGIQELCEQVDTLIQRNQVLEQWAREQEARQKKADERIEKLASLVAQLMNA